MSARFAIVYPDRVREVDSSLPPEALSALVGQALDLMVVFEIPVPDVQIWQQEEGMWHPLFGARHAKPTLHLSVPTHVKIQEADQRYLKLGTQAVRLYRLWKWQHKSAEAQLRKIACGGFVQGSAPVKDHLVDIADVLIRKMGVIDDIVGDFSDLRLQTVFDYTVMCRYSPQKIADLLHYSVSTVHRNWRLAKIWLGHGLESRLSPEQRTDFLAEIERAHWSVARLLGD